jgi:hypothetical protein
VDYLKKTMLLCWFVLPTQDKKVNTGKFTFIQGFPADSPIIFLSVSLSLYNQREVEIQTRHPISKDLTEL